MVGDGGGEVGLNRDTMGQPSLVLQLKVYRVSKNTRHICITRQILKYQNTGVLIKGLTYF